jgi:hypothetical protein
MTTLAKNTVKANAQTEVKNVTETAVVEQTTPTTSETKKEKEEVKIINISEAKVGDIIRYASSKKPYIVAEQRRDEKGKYVSSLLVSKTQTYVSKKPKFEVVVLVDNGGNLPKEIKGDAFLTELLGQAQATVKTLQQKEQEQIKKDAERKAKAEAKKVEEVAAVTVETPQAEKKGEVVVDKKAKTK